jgi:hypothetical protein
MTEVWKEVKEMEGLLEVSNLGRVRTLPRLITCSANTRKKYLKKGAILAACDNGNGYKQVFVIIRSIRYLFYIHRLVAQAFLPKPTGSTQVNHKDFNRANNRVENLEWCTAQENHLHTVRAGRPRKRASDYAGVRRAHTVSVRWVASVRFNNKQIYIGTFLTQKEAAEARDRYIIAHNLPHPTQANPAEAKKLGYSVSRLSKD